MSRLDELIDSGDWEKAVIKAVKDEKNERKDTPVTLNFESLYLEMGVEDDPNDKYSSILFVEDAEGELNENIGPFGGVGINNFVETVCALVEYEVSVEEALENRDAMDVLDDTIEDYGSFKIKPIFRLKPDNISLVGGEYDLDEFDVVKEKMAEKLEDELNEYAQLPCRLERHDRNIVIMPEDFEPIYESIKDWGKDEPEYDIPTEELEKFRK